LPRGQTLKPEPGAFHGSASIAVVIGQPVDRDLPRLSWVPPCIRYVPSHEERYWISLAGSFDAYLQKFSAKTRNTFRRKVRRLSERANGSMRLQEYGTPADILEFLRRARAIAVRTYQQRMGLALPGDDAFRRRLLERAEQGQVRGYILSCGDRPAAFAYLPAQGDNLVYEKLGHDPEFAPWSPGTVLLYLVLERLFEEQRFRTLDFGEQEFSYKRFFATDQLRCANVLYLCLRPGNCALVASHHLLFLLDSAIATTVTYLGVKEWLKRVLHPGANPPGDGLEESGEISRG
jgi:hypothetical protein